MKLIIKAKPRYIKYLAKHLQKEHPATKERKNKSEVLIMAKIGKVYIRQHSEPIKTGIPFGHFKWIKRL